MFPIEHRIVPISLLPSGTCFRLRTTVGSAGYVTHWLWHQDQYKRLKGHKQRNTAVWSQEMRRYSADTEVFVSATTSCTGHSLKAPHPNSMQNQMFLQQHQYDSRNFVKRPTKLPKGMLMGVGFDMPDGFVQLDQAATHTTEKNRKRRSFFEEPQSSHELQKRSREISGCIDTKKVRPSIKMNRIQTD